MEVIGILRVLELSYLFLFSYWFFKPKRKKDYSLQILQWDQSRQIRMSLFDWQTQQQRFHQRRFKKMKGFIYLSSKKPLVFVIPVSSLGLWKHTKRSFLMCIFLFVWDPEHWFGRLAEENTRVTNSFNNWRNSETSLSDFLETLVKTFSTLLQKVVDYPVI